MAMPGEGIYDSIVNTEKPKSNTKNTEAISQNMQMDSLPILRNTSGLIQGVLWAEILGRPVSKRKGRGRYGF